MNTAKKIIAQKIGMTQVWQNDRVVPGTTLKIKEGKEAFEQIKEGSRVTIRGVSKGKGFQGVVKRHGFHGGPKSHGQKDRLRAPGSIGATAPQRVMKGKKMAGRMGGRTTTRKNVLVVRARQEKNELIVKGPVPGMRGSVIEIKLASHK